MGNNQKKSSLDAAGQVHMGEGSPLGKRMLALWVHCAGREIPRVTGKQGTIVKETYAHEFQFSGKHAVEI